ncbi:MAG TPA: TlpA disulfide reductase family protein [Kofleriaceae bacterium]|nr:TlpA disulfide reductase family protein [Kofleriaceae bacterium]
MDRLHALIATGALLVACNKEGGDEKGKPVEGEGRVNAVETVAKKEVTVEEFCDVLPTSAAEAKPLALPPLSAGQSAPAAAAGWRWINVWATWCQPCIDEMPLLATWQKQLGGEGLKVDLVFLSADENDQQVAEFRKKHPQTPESLRIDKPDSLPTWLGAIGLGENAPIPVHVLIDPANKMRCVRAGQVKESDLPAIRALLKSS